MRQTADEFIAKYGCDYMINTEQIPGESAAAKLMQKDKFFYPEADIYDLPLYGNQFIPLGIQTTGQERVRIAAESTDTAMVDQFSTIISTHLLTASIRRGIWSTILRTPESHTLHSILRFRRVIVTTHSTERHAQCAESLSQQSIPG